MHNMPPDPFTNEGTPELGQLPPDLLFIKGLNVEEVGAVFGADTVALQQAKDRANAALEVLKDGMSPQSQAVAQTELDAAKRAIFGILNIDTEDNKQL
ncbi:MAG: hypothetical protein QG629_112 [Patescibacteria group bacterium]|nr:hypothetical protein [Candidatus Saccharibacteria bacterium]MDQ5963030.1 hypothetical protein [Patescibacteria group bacterium]